MALTLRGQLDNLRLVSEAFEAATLTARHFGTGRFAAFRKALQCTRKSRMRPWEAFDYGLLAPGGPAPSEVLSKRSCVNLQKQLNPQHWFWVTEDKGIFQRFCELSSIPVPRCEALLLHGAYGMADGRPIAPSRDAWMGFLGNIDLGNVVIKPCRHSRGKGVIVPEGGSEVMRTGDRRLEGVAALVDFMFEDPELDSWIVQQRIWPHPALVELSGTEYMQTLRLYTLIGSQGQASVLPGFLKVIAGGATVDTLQQGQEINMRAAIDLSTGYLTDAVSRSPSHQWLRVERHPRTGRSFSEVQVPHWEEAVETIQRGALALRPIRSLAWDIALTPDGPVIIEANIRWDPPNFDLSTVRRVREALEQADSKPADVCGP